MGGGAKRRLRIIDFKRDRIDAPAKVLGIEYDPNRTSRIALVQYPDKEKRYIIAPLNLDLNSQVISTYNEIEIKAGNCTHIKYIPLGIPIHNIELTRGKGGQIVRSAGSSAVITAKEGSKRHITKLLVTHDGSTPIATEYGVVYTNSELAGYDIQIQGPVLQILATPASSASTTFNIVATLIDA